MIVKVDGDQESQLQLEEEFLSEGSEEQEQIVLDPLQQIVLEMEDNQSAAFEKNLAKQKQAKSFIERALQFIRSEEQTVDNLNKTSFAQTSYDNSLKGSSFIQRLGRRKVSTSNTKSCCITF